MTIDAWIFRAAERHPEKPALIFGGDTLSYAAMAREIAARADALRGAGVARGDRVAWYGYNHPEMFILLFACARIGAIFAPLNWRLAEAELVAIVASCAPKLVIHDPNFAAQARALPDVATVAIGAPMPPGAGTSSAEPGEDDPILLVYTSGATGRPKGVVLTQKALICNAAMSVEAHAMTPADRVLNVLPLFHVGGLNILPTPAFSICATVVLHAKFDADATCAALQQVTLAITVPTVLRAVMATDAWASADLGGLKAISIGSTDVPVALLAAVRARGVAAIQIYGATETAPLAIYQRVGDAAGAVGSIGQVGSGCEVRLMCDGVEAGPGQSGEIWVKGDNVMREYWREPGLTTEGLRDGWFCTGDAATRDEAGAFWFRDRIKHVVISGGENIYPAEIERILHEHPNISEVAVVGRRDATWGEVPVAVVVAAGPVSAAEILTSLDGRLARYKHPRDVVFVGGLPKNAMGKVVVTRVRAMVGSS